MSATNCAAVTYVTEAKKYDEVKHLGLRKCHETKWLKPKAACLYSNTISGAS